MDNGLAGGRDRIPAIRPLADDGGWDRLEEMAVIPRRVGGFKRHFGSKLHRI